MGREVRAVEQVPCGNLCALVGVNEYIKKTATISALETSHCFRDMNFFVSPVVSIGVQPEIASELPKFIEGLKKLVKTNLMLYCSIEETGEQILSGTGEFHLEICLKDLQDDYAQIALRTSGPTVSYRETVTRNSDTTCCSKSPNKHNRLFMSAQPLAAGLVTDIDDGVIHADHVSTANFDRLVQKYDWNESDARNIWCFGPNHIGPNILVDTRRNIQYLDELKAAAVRGFQWASQEVLIFGNNLITLIYKLLIVACSPFYAKRKCTEFG